MSSQAPVAPLGDVPPQESSPSHHAHVEGEAYTADEIGDILFDNFVAFLRWCLSNVKGVSNLVVALMIVVFVNYSQQVVQLTIEAAVNADPALDTSYELKAAAAAFTNEMRSYIDVAQTAALSFVSANASCLQTITAGSAAAGFLQVVSSMQQSFGADLYYIYVTYRVPDGSGNWGECGCQQWPGIQDVVCTYVSATGTETLLRRGDPSQVFRQPVQNAFVTNLDYVQRIQTMTAADQPDGVWHMPSSYLDPSTNLRQVVITYTYPIAFDPITGKCTLAASVDVSLLGLRNKIQMIKSNKETILIDGRLGGIYLVSTRNSVFDSSTVFAASNTPSARINTIVSTVVAANGGLMQNSSFLSNGLTYESLTIMGIWQFISRSPAANGGLMMASAFQSLLNEYERATATALVSANLSSQTCQQVAASGQATSPFLLTVQYLQQTFGARITSIYSSYPLANLSSSFGACGCTLLTVPASSSQQQNSQLVQQCFYVDDSGTEYDYLGGSFKVPAGSTTFFLKKRSSNIVATLGLGGKVGWSTPYLQDGSGDATITYAMAITNAAGLGVLGANLELSLTFLPQFFSRYQTNGTDYFMIDTRPPVYLLGCMAFATSGLLQIANATRNQTINNILGYVMQRLEYDLTSNASIPYLDYLINFQVVAPYFAVIEMIPQGTATQLFFPVPQVQTVSDALHLIPANQTMGLFMLVVLFMLLFTLNMFLVCCSDLGVAPGDAAPAAAPAPQPVAVSTATEQKAPLQVLTSPSNLSTDDANLASAVPMDEVKPSSALDETSDEVKLISAAV